MKDVVLLAATRTPIGAFQGALKDVPTPRLGATTIRKSLEEAKISPDQVDECLMGCVLPAGLGQAPARQAALYAELPHSVCCTTVNRVCASGLRTVMWAAQMIQTGDAELVVAGGMENMDRAPYLLDKAREGYRLGNGTLTDSMVKDGLWEVYNDYHMGNAAELCAKEKNISREDQDRYCIQSYQRALASIEAGLFKNEIVPVEIKTRKGTNIIDTDEEPFKVKMEKIPTLRPVFQKDGTVTAANASSLSDGASSLVVASKEKAESLSVKPIARIVAQANHAQAPEWFTTAPTGAIQKMLKKVNLKPNDIDLYEINEAFASVAIANVRDLGLDESKVNVRGGAIALGHPLGASGARVLTTLVHALIGEKKRLGVAALCLGGGEASAILIENLT